MTAGQLISLTLALEKVRESLRLYKDETHEKVQETLKELMEILEKALND
jgi:signal transduction histidine kinase